MTRRAGGSAAAAGVAGRRLGRAPGARRRGDQDLPVPGLRPGDPARPRRTSWCGRRRPMERTSAGTGTTRAGSAGRGGPVPAPRTAAEEPMTEITASTVLPARREPITLRTADGLTLVGELALPGDRPPVATLICLHPLPTHGGMMDSHVLRKAAYRLPALADLAVLRFNTRGTELRAGHQRGRLRRRRGASGSTWPPRIAYVRRSATCRGSGCSAGRSAPSSRCGWGCDPASTGAILLSPPLHRAGDADLDAWAAFGQAAGRAGPGVRRLPAAGRGPRALRPGAAGRGGRRRRAPSTCGWASGTSGSCSTRSCAGSTRRPGRCRRRRTAECD